MSPYLDIHIHLRRNLLDFIIGTALLAIAIPFIWVVLHVLVP